MSRIGFQNGVEAARLRMKKLDPAGFKPDGSGAWDKFFRTISHLVIAHDEQFPATPPPPPPPPPPPKLNPQTYNKGSNGQDARYCVTHDDGYRYDSGGREIDGRRSGQFIPELKAADEMDGREPCDPYTKDGRSFPPWPAKSYER